MFTDFQFGDNFASDFGLMVATFDSSGGVETVSSGSTLTFNTVKSVGQDISELYGSTYDEDYSFTIQLCRLDNHCNPIPLMPEEYGAINRWLNRKTFDQFKINKEGYENIRFYGTFNVQAVKINEDIYGIECTFTSNAPYGFAKERTHTFSNVKSFYIYDDSDEVGEIYPYTVITCNEAGTLRGGMYRLKCAAQLDGNCMPSWSNHTYNNGFTAILDLLTIQSGYGTTDANEIVLSYQQKFISDSKNPIGYKQLINSSKPVLWLRGGGIYQIYSEWNTEWTILTESTTITNETISPTTTPPGIVFKKKSDIYANLQGSSTYLNGFQGSISNTANTYVLRDKNKYVNLNYINSDTAKNENVAISQVIVTNDSDNYYRKTSLAHLKTSLGLMPPEANSNNYIKVYNDYTANAGKNNEKTANDIANAGFAVGMINGATSNPLGKKAWFHIINMGWDTRTTNSAGLWTSQLAFGTEAGTGMYYRTTNSGAQISTIGWARVLDSSCYKSYCPPISHASSAVTYGKSTSANYGHTKLSDTYTSAVGTADSGIAPSQTALYNVYKKIPKFSLSGTTLTITTT